MPTNPVLREEPDQPPSDLKLRKCPACGKDGVPRRGPSGWFSGCPDFPKCPGKAYSMSAEQRKRSAKMLRFAYEYINRMGGVREAEHWLKLAKMVVLTVKGGVALPKIPDIEP